jgi:ATP-binding cassette subfamily B protein
MSSGLDNIVGEGGVSLSGGQRQRLALARIVLRASGLVLLDDPLSAVDVRTEEQIIGNLRSIWSDLTVVLTSNKPASLACCDVSAQVTAKGLSFDAADARVQNVTEEAVHV